ncbi:hypothetical protein [Alistipes onderdonkii]|uniref:hypothetical protein n=1 Tax=Alistipes onderdonkii TaxID=328813 RepID=UPI001E5C2DC7|nr:hypothetical protein [Alistipes onderdonkii]
MTTRTQENIVSSYFYYMWNAWSQKECRTLFGTMTDHYWTKWEQLYGRFHGGAAERFYAELSTTNRRLVVERACELYDGNRRRASPKYSAKQPEKIPERPVIIIAGAPKSLANLFMAESIPFAYSLEKFIIFDSATPQVCREHLERRGVPRKQLDDMKISQREISINDISLP